MDLPELLTKVEKTFHQLTASYKKGVETINKLESTSPEQKEKLHEITEGPIHEVLDKINPLVNKLSGMLSKAKSGELDGT